MINASLGRIYKSGNTKLSPELFNATSSAFRHAAATGVANSGQHVEKAFLNKLAHSADVFSAFKSHAQQSELVKLLRDDKGVLRSFSQFRKEAGAIVGKYNRNWLRTEYATAVSRSHHAANWQQYKEEMDILPCLEWEESTSPSPGADHSIFWGTIQPVDSTFWDEHRPGDRWNCQCSLSQTDKAPTIAPNADSKSVPQPGLDNNTGRDGKLFNESHPYFPKSCSACPFPKNKLAALYHDLTDDRDCHNCKFMYNTITNCKITNFESVRKFDNGGEILVNALVNRNDSDYNELIDSATFFAKQGGKVELMPKMSRPAKFEYDCVYGGLKGTKFYGKCPDMRINGKWYEEEGFTSTNPKNAFRNMMNDGLKQSSCLIIAKPDLTDAYMKRIITQRVKEGQDVEEVYIKENKKLRLLYKKLEKS